MKANAVMPNKTKVNKLIALYKLVYNLKLYFCC